MSDDENRFKRINVNKIILIKELFDKTISNLELSFNNLDKISSLNLTENNGKTKIILNFSDGKKKYVFVLKNNRNVDRNLINLIKKDGIIAQIS